MVDHKGLGLLEGRVVVPAGLELFGGGGGEVGDRGAPEDGRRHDGGVVRGGVVGGDGVGGGVRAVCPAPQQQLLTSRQPRQAAARNDGVGGGGGGGEAQRLRLLLLEGVERRLLGVAPCLPPAPQHSARFVARAQLEQLTSVRFVAKVAQPLECSKKERVQTQAVSESFFRLRNSLSFLQTSGKEGLKSDG